jgi:hypothetical protein
VAHAASPDQEEGVAPEGQKEEAASVAPEGQAQEASSGREEPQTPLSPSAVPVRRPSGHRGSILKGDPQAA